MANIKQVFISHATQDAPLARRLAKDLRRYNVPVWIAPDSIRYGEKWVDAIERGLKESSHIVVILTPAAVQSRWVKTETNIAIDLEHRGQIQIIPLDVKPCEASLFVRSYQMVSFRSSYNDGFMRLASTLGLRTSTAKVSRPRPVVKKTSPPVTSLQPSWWPLPAATTAAIIVAILALLVLGNVGITTFNKLQTPSSTPQASLLSQVSWPLVIGATALLVGAIWFATYWQGQER